MSLVEFGISPWYTFMIKINWVLVVGIIVLVMLIKWLWYRFKLFQRLSNIQVDEVQLGIGSGSSVKLSYNNKDREIAYKLWVELNTRKIGMMLDEENEVIVEVYNSWYAFFGIARGLMKEIPIKQFGTSSELILLSGRVLNEGLRPHLTKWQARFRKWYADALENELEKSPQEIQKEFPQYDELIHDLKKTNEQMIYMKNLMYKIAFGNEEKR